MDINEGLFATKVDGVKALQPIRIQSVVIQNYKSIDYREYFLDGKSLFLRGKNGLGKTNVLEAIYWALSGLLFDGTAKAERQEIKPTGSEPETETSVKITFMGGNEFTVEKKLSEKYDSKGAFKGNEVSLLINGTPIGIRDGQDRINQELGLDNVLQAFKKDPNLSDIDVMALFYNAETINSMDYKQLRALIISIIGDVSFEQTMLENLEMYQVVQDAWNENKGTLEDLKSATKNAIHDKNNGLQRLVNDTEAVLRQYETDSKQELNPVEIATAKSEIARIETEIRKLRNEQFGGEETLVANYNSKITSKELELSNLKLELTKLHNEKIEKLTDGTLEKEISEKRKSLGTLRDTKNTNTETIGDLNGKKTSLEQLILSKKSELTREKAQLVEYQKQYKEIGIAKNDTAYTCPHCNQAFNVSESAEFKNHIAQQKSTIISLGNTCKERVKALELAIEELELDKAELLKNILHHQNERTQLETNINAIYTDIQTLEEQNTKKRASLPTLNLLDNKDYLVIMSAIETLKNEKRTALDDISAHKEQLETEIKALETERLLHQEVVNKETMIEDYKEKSASKRHDLATLKIRLQVKKELTSLIKDLERETYSKLDIRLSKIFGDDFRFQLYKENVSNGEYDTRMCEMYVKDSHGKYVNIKRINTGLFPIRCAEFISIVKRHYGVPQSFVFVDEVSSLDTEHRNFLRGFGEQVIATSINDSTSIETVIE